ncbi:MAG: hypothetical protein H6822_10565 [Planctomycetaceae bacterium]|nr:hypothetical protein [Planctomycetaceae bacterium]
MSEWCHKNSEFVDVLKLSTSPVEWAASCRQPAVGCRRYACVIAAVWILGQAAWVSAADVDAAASPVGHAFLERH